MFWSIPVGSLFSGAGLFFGAFLVSKAWDNQLVFWASVGIVATIIGGTIIGIQAMLKDHETEVRWAVERQQERERYR